MKEERKEEREREREREREDRRRKNEREAPFDDKTREAKVIIPVA